MEINRLFDGIMKNRTRPRAAVENTAPRQQVMDEIASDERLPVGALTTDQLTLAVATANALTSDTDSAQEPETEPAASQHAAQQPAAAKPDASQPAEPKPEATQPVAAEPPASETANVPEPSKGVRGVLLAKALALAVLAVLVAFAICGAWLAMVKYKIRDGLIGSPFIGFRNFLFITSSGSLPTLALNTLRTALAQCCGGLLLALPLLLWIKVSRSAGRALTKACVCLIPACIPALSVFYLLYKLPHPAGMFSSLEYYYPIYAMITALQTGGFIAFCGGLFDYLGRRGIGSGVRYGVLTAMLILCLRILSPNLQATLSTYNALVYSVADTLDSYAYRTGMMDFNIQVSAAMQTIKLIFQSLIAIVPAAILVKLSRRDDTRLSLPDQRGSVAVWLFAAVVWVALITALVLYTTGEEYMSFDSEELAGAFAAAAQNEGIVGGVAASVIAALGGGILAGLVAYGFIHLNRTNAKGFGIASIVLASAGSYIMIEYLAVRSLNLVNTPVIQILAMVFNPQLICVTIALTVALRMAPERRTRGLAGGLMFIAGSLSWGDFYNAMIYTNDRTMLPLSMLLRQMLLGQGSMAGEMTSSADLLLRDATMSTYALLVTIPAILLAAIGAALMVRAFKKAE